MQYIPEKIHFIGIGGAGMSGLAKVLLDQKLDVRGSDINTTPVTDRLCAQGAVIYIGHAGENIGDAEMVIYSSAISFDNCEMLAARNKGIPTLHRADLMSLLMKQQKGLAVAGAHGKTTTSAMLALVLEKCGQDPTILIGGELTYIGGNAKHGQGDFLVAEADESDRSFLKLHPFLAVITNIEDDHLENYGSMENIIHAFRQFIDKLPPHTGTAVLCYDNRQVISMAKDYEGRVISYALNNQGADYTMRNIQINALRSSGEVFYQDLPLGLLELTVPGQHNLSNALAVVAVCRCLGLSFPKIAGCLKHFKGTGRRYQTIGQVRGITIVDDYAHHPTEIATTLLAARQVHNGRIIAVFQPHRYTRTIALYKRFGNCFNNADLVLINDIYSAGEKPVAGVTSHLIVDSVQQNVGERVLYLATQEETADYLMDILQAGDLVLTMGAGDVWQIGADLVNKLNKLNEPKEIIPLV